MKVPPLLDVDHTGSIAHSIGRRTDGCMEITWKKKAEEVPIDT
jgi:hypothetical protein